MLVCWYWYRYPFMNQNMRKMQRLQGQGDNRWIDSNILRVALIQLLCYHKCYHNIRHQSAVTLQVTKKLFLSKFLTQIICLCSKSYIFFFFAPNTRTTMQLKTLDKSVLFLKHSEIISISEVFLERLPAV